MVDSQMEKFKDEVLKSKRSNSYISNNGVLGYKGGQIYVPNDEEIKSQIFYEAYNTPYTTHPGTTKMCRD